MEAFLCANQIGRGLGPQQRRVTQKVRRRGIEPRPLDWKSSILATELSTHWMRTKTGAFDGIRTRDLSLTKRVLCQLSYDGNSLYNLDQPKIYTSARDRTGDLSRVRRAS